MIGITFWLRLKVFTQGLAEYSDYSEAECRVFESPRAHQHQIIMKKIFLVIALCLGAFIVQAATAYGTVTVSKVISVYDGDTFRVNIDSLPPLVGKNIPIRLKGVDTPEIQGKCQYERNLALRQEISSEVNSRMQKRLDCRSFREASTLELLLM